MRPSLWTIVLAAGAGRRLSSLTGGVPKQFWCASGSRTLLEDTLDRTTLVARPDRTVIVVDRSQAAFVRALPELAAFDRIVYQPGDRGTAAGVLLGLANILQVAGGDPLVLLTPSDHGIDRPAVFARGIRHTSREIGAGRANIVLFGVAPGSAEGDYGWIAPAGPESPDALRGVTAFVEKPAPAHAAELFEAGAVWNTMVLVGRARALLDLFARHQPALTDHLLVAFASSDDGRPAAIVDAYEQLPAVDLSRDVLGPACGLHLYTWPASMGWSDLGTPERLSAWLGHRLRRPVRRAARAAIAPAPLIQHAG